MILFPQIFFVQSARHELQDCRLKVLPSAVGVDHTLPHLPLLLPLSHCSGNCTLPSPQYVDEDEDERDEELGEEDAAEEEGVEDVLEELAEEVGVEEGAEEFPVELPPLFPVEDVLEAVEEPQGLTGLQPQLPFTAPQTVQAGQ